MHMALPAVSWVRTDLYNQRSRPLLHDRASATPIVIARAPASSVTTAPLGG